ncbi:MAG: hypothetical protein ACLFT6_04270 [Bacteroidales bacterium]
MKKLISLFAMVIFMTGFIMAQNSAETTQEGENNSGEQTQEGSSNEGQIESTGTEHVGKIYQVGDNHDASQEQHGNNNKAVSTTGNHFDAEGTETEQYQDGDNTYLAFKCKKEQAIRLCPTRMVTTTMYFIM